MSKKESLYQSRKKIYPKLISGFYQRWRRIFGIAVYGLFFLVPWINLDDRPIVYFDLAQRQFHLLGLNFWPQDFMFLAWFLIIAAYSLFTFTNIAGRLWCGFLCPQTIWTLAFVWVEDKIEGNSYHRKKIDQQDKLTANQRAKRVAKYVVWLLMALLTGATFVSYFYPARELYPALLSGDITLTPLVWVGIFTYLTFIDAAVLREQVCIYMCPYARFQSVMYDENTLAVAYNPDIGEPRASLKAQKSGKIENAGGCIDCSLCVQVCPTGIDIRDGMQIDCINCGLCVDACADVMESVDRPKNLITFNTLNRLNGKETHLIRPRTVGYSIVLFAMITLFTTMLFNRVAVEASVIRERDRIYRVNAQHEVSNYYLLKIANKSQEDQSYTVNIETEGFKLAKSPVVTLKKGQMVERPLTVLSPQKDPGSYPITFEVISTKDQSILKTIESRYIFPSQR
ncbi:Uncharacterised protein [BD1-7 clade bacterium]|uniref:4Fe-4S ferredoxin-type domain-containing protein n=1 Tax=BD1-7 clade bacterium TaxID=2029982 RepID=A0A5S9QQI5_9GAMM|nr:Uncharacterised protein [BD1-7 clade bacterium]CAA0121897.1 Uncharacterised protein [BD1-7 clade bacterium]